MECVKLTLEAEMRLTLHQHSQIWALKSRQLYAQANMDCNKSNITSKGLSIDTSHVKIHDKASMTTALEFKKGNEKTNVMVRDLGSLANFGSKGSTKAIWV